METNSKYLPRNGQTFCNLFVADVTKALNAPIPLYVIDSSGRTRWLNANAMQDWLLNEGRGRGWYEVQGHQAQMYANQGRPVVASWKNPTGDHGHFAMVRPTTDAYDPRRGPRIAQAGLRNYNSTDAVTGFGASKLAQVRYFVYLG